MTLKKGFWKFGFFSLFLTFSLALPVIAVSKAYAQDYPTRPIKIVVPYAPGGASSLIWRGIADPLSKVLGQPVLIENKPGGGTSLAWTYVAGAKPDGYTVGGAPVSTLTNTYLTYKVSYHPINSFVHIGGIWQYNQAFVVGTSSPWKNWKEFFNYVRDHPNEVTVGYTNPTALAPITIKWIGKSNGLVWKEVHFTSEAECVTALLGKHIDAFVGTGVVHTLLADGRARALLAITRGRMPGHPDVPTVKELYGRDCFNSAGMIAPAGVPEHIMRKLENALQEGVKSPEYLKTLEKMGTFPLWRNHDEFKKDVQATMEDQKHILKAIGMLRKELE